MEVLVKKLDKNINSPFVIIDIGSTDCIHSIKLYHKFPNAQIYIFECCPDTINICKQNIELHKDRITLFNGPVHDYKGYIDICYINDNDYKFIENKLAVNRVGLLVNKHRILFDNTSLKLEMFCIYHKRYYFREDNFYFTPFGVNETYQKDNTIQGHLEYELDIYNPFLQKRGYMETSAYLHVFWNKLYTNKKMIGFSQYDMKHANIYNDLNSNKIYLLNANNPIVEDGTWNSLMFPKIRNLDFLLESYNKHFKKTYSIKDLENMPLSLWQTNIYPVKIYEKLCSWLEILVEEIYPWSNEPPYETHFGSIGGYTERAISIFNAFEIVEGISYINLDLQHGIGAMEKEQYNHNSFLNNYSQDIYCKIKDNVNFQEYDIIGNAIKNNGIIQELSNGITKFYYIDNNGNRSKELMIFGDNQNCEFKWHHNILNCDLNNYELYYKLVKNNTFNISIKNKI
jgi:hypothetical protein